MAQAPRNPPIARLGRALERTFSAVMPDPFIIAILLTALTYLLVVLTTDTTPLGAAMLWSGGPDADPVKNSGVWKFLGFGMQMCLILVTGHALACSPPIAKALRALATLPRTGPQAAALVALVAASLGVINWGFGLIGGALFAREVGRAMLHKRIPIHYPVLAAAGYLGLMVWHGGLSGTAPLKVTTPAQIADALPPGTTLAPIPLQDTLLSPLNLIVTGGLLLLTPLVFALLMPRPTGDPLADAKGLRPIDDYVAIPKQGHEDPLDRPGEDHPPPKGLHPFVELLERTPTLNLLLAGLIAVWAFNYYTDAGFTRLTPDTVNLTMLMLGLLLHPSPMSYLRAVEDAAKGCAGIIIQFPLYAGIMAMMAGSGLTATLATLLSDLAGPASLAPATAVSAGVVNLFVPSGGGQWAVQGPIALETAATTGVSPAKLVMAVAYGDQLTNMLQPFWALPLLAITGVRARDIVGYTAIAMILATIWTLAWLWIL